MAVVSPSELSSQDTLANRLLSSSGMEIAEATGASTATISRVNRSLIYGNDGYAMVFERIEI